MWSITLVRVQLRRNFYKIRLDYCTLKLNLWGIKFTLGWDAIDEGRSYHSLNYEGWFEKNLSKFILS